MVLKTWFERLLQYEALAKTDKFIATLLKDLAWPQLQWARMVLFGLYEADFESVPAWLFRRVLSAWAGLTFTKPTEDLNRDLRNLEKVLNLNLQASRQSRWYALVTSKVPSHDDNWKPLIVMPPLQ
jgi:hypothetical protein